MGIKWRKRFGNVTVEQSLNGKETLFPIKRISFLQSTAKIMVLLNQLITEKEKSLFKNQKQLRQSLLLKSNLTLPHSKQLPQRMERVKVMVMVLLNQQLHQVEATSHHI